MFNQLYARHTGGTFLLRIEDTDRARSTEANVQVIHDGLSWLGVVPDAPPVFQFARAERHAAVVQDMLAKGGAYRDWTTAEELEAERERARAEGRVVRSVWRDADPAKIPNDRPFAVRLRAPQDGETVVRDLVKGDVTFRNTELDDLVLLRSDGTPTYNLAVVVDDHDMGVTHVIRGDDHLNNAARQSLIYRAIGWEVPAFAHIPLIHGPDGAKLSKRHGAQAVGEFAEMGYLPEAMRNYLARLGWGHGDSEIFTDEQAAELVRRGRCGEGARPARLGQAQLRQPAVHPERRTRRAWPIWSPPSTAHADLISAPDRLAALPHVVSLVKEAAQTVLQLADLTAFAMRSRPVGLDEKGVTLLTVETSQRLKRLEDFLRVQTDWTKPSLEAAVRGFAETEGVGIGKFGPALRAVLGGGAPVPDLASALLALGMDESLGRLHDALSQAQ